MNDFENHCWQDVMPTDAYEIYAPYQRETRIVGKPGLVAIDLFTCVFPDAPLEVTEAIKSQPRSCGIYAYEAIDPIKALLAEFREQDLPVIFTTSPAVDGKEAPRHATNRKIERGRPENSHGFDIHPAFERAENEPLVRKERASGFFNTQLKEILDMQGISTVVLCGETTSGCVRATAVDAYSHGYHVVLAEESVFDRSILSHKVSLFDLHHKYADVIKNDEIISLIREGSQ